MGSTHSNKQAVMSFIDELKRRNVIKVAIAYAVIAWILMQVAATTFPALKLPDWTVTLVAVLILIGFPLALIFAWAFELTPEGIKLEKDVVRSESTTHITGRKVDFTIITVLVLALVYFAYEEYVIDPAQEQALIEAGTQAEATSETATRDMSIAVLPFVNMSDDPGNEYFSDGMSEEVLNLLVKIPDLKVIARTSSFAFKGKNEDLRVIGQKLGVTTVLEGSVRKSGDRVRITAQLVNVSDGTHIWSETYNRTMTDIFAVQDDVAAAIIDTLQIHVGANPTRGRPTENTAAYALFLKARVAVNVSELRFAKELLFEAIELDPKFAEAYELLAFCYWWLTGIDVPYAEAQELVRETLAKALANNSDLVFAQALLEATKFENHSLYREIEAYERAAREQPGNSAVAEALVFDLLETGYLREAVEVAERFVELDPLSASVNILLFQALFASNRTNDAMAALEVAEQLGSVNRICFRGNINLLEKQDEIAMEYLVPCWQGVTWVRELVTGARDPATGQALLDRLIPEIIASVPVEQSHSTWRHIVMWYPLFGFLDRYLEIMLDTIAADGIWSGVRTLAWWGTINRRSGFTTHPKYVEVAEALGYVDLWEQRGPPDFCEKVDGEWVCE